MKQNSTFSMWGERITTEKV